MSIPFSQKTPSKLFGAYPQKQKGLYMQRIPVFAGDLSPLQLKALAELAVEFTDQTPLHLTTRQDIELHQVRPDDLETIQQRLEGLGLPTTGAGGDSVRNITVCPCCSFQAEAFDIQPLGQLIRDFLNKNELLNDMPRKFKISLAGCRQPQSKPFVNDLSFIATSRTTVRVIGAGSLGAAPQTGIELFEQLPVEDVLPLTAGALKLFVDHGDRRNRRKARLRHIRLRLGDAAFREMLNDYFQAQKQQGDWPAVTLSPGRSGWDHHTRLQVLRGDLDVNDALGLAQAADEQGAQLRVNLTHGIDIYSRNAFKLPERLKPLTERACIVACPGSTTCKNGLTDCPQLASQLAQALGTDAAWRDKTIAISGCPNGCAHSSVADIGLSGMMKTINGKREAVYRVLLDGGNGQTNVLAAPDRIVSADELADYLRSL